MIREWIWMVIFTARQNLANLNEVKMNLIVKFANLAGKSYNSMHCVYRSQWNADHWKSSVYPGGAWFSLYLYFDNNGTSLNINAQYQ